MRGPTERERVGLAILRKIILQSPELPIIVDTDAMPKREKSQVQAAFNWIDRVIEDRHHAMRG